jgi:hypothetical protein
MTPRKAPSDSACGRCRGQQGEADDEAGQIGGDHPREGVPGHEEAADDLLDDEGDHREGEQSRFGRAGEAAGRGHGGGDRRTGRRRDREPDLESGADPSVRAIEHDERVSDPVTTPDASTITP